MATEESTPTKMRMKGNSFAGATLTTLRISAAISPAFSATPTPAIETSTTATTPKRAKLSTNEAKKNRSPSMESRLRIGNSCSVTTNSGSVAGSPVVES